MSESRKIRLAVIGLGMATKPHLEALSELSGKVEVSGVLNRTRAKADAVSVRYGWPVFENLDEVLKDDATDGAIIATPPNQRVEFARKLAGSGKHILMEKPIERTLCAARSIVEDCEAAGVCLGIVFQHRFRKAARRVRELIRNGELGDLALVRAEIPWWRDQAYYDEPGRGSLERDGGGVLISQAIHVLDLMLSLAGPVRNVQAFTATTSLHEMETEDFATAGLEFGSGAVGSVMATTATYPGDQERLVLDGTRARAALDGGQLNVVWHDGREEHLGEEAGTGGGADPMAFPCDWHRDLIEDFSSAILSGRPPAVPGREALRVHALIDAMIRSGRNGSREEVEQI